ncbi:MAG: hypothetical protein LDL26_06520 [Caenispirillum bisanense]|nr:hypothetical protein [Caenispirillum bisanense]
MLGRAAKEAGTSPKILFGTFATDEKIVTLTSEVPPITGVARRIRLLLRQAKLNLTIRLLGPDGEVAEEDRDEEDEGGGAESGGSGQLPKENAEDDASPDLSDAALFTGLRAEIVDLGKEHRDRLNKAQAAELSTVLKSADAARDAGRLDEAIGLLRRLQQRLDDLLQAPDDDGEDEAGAVRADVASARTTVVALGREKLSLIAEPERKRLSNALRRADTLIEEGRDEDAADILIPLRDDLDYAGQETDLLPIWRATKEAIDDQIAVLRHVLRSFEDPDLEQIAEKGFGVLTGQRNAALVAALLDYRSGGGSEARAALLRAIDAYEDLLASGSILEDYDNNPYGASVKLRETLSLGLRTLRDRAG